MRYADPYAIEHAALVALLKEWDDVDPRQRFRAWSRITTEVTQRGSAFSLFDERNPPTLDGSREPDAALRLAADRLGSWQSTGFQMVTILDRDFPMPLKRIEQVSPLLFTTGTLHTGEAGVAVVGSREASVRGQQFAADLARGLVRRRITVISGLANGIDTAAHRATLAARGRTIAVLGTGVARVYPPTNRALHKQIASTGVLVSSFWPDSPPDRHSLTLRNVTMAGLSRASVIVEAGERSGSRVHARYAQTFGRPLILTSDVVDSTQWGRQYARQPGVFVADSVTAVLDAIDQVVSGVDAQR